MGKRDWGGSVPSTAINRACWTVAPAATRLVWGSRHPAPPGRAASPSSWSSPPRGKGRSRRHRRRPPAPAPGRRCTKGTPSPPGPPQCPATAWGRPAAGAARRWTRPRQARRSRAGRGTSPAAGAPCGGPGRTGRRRRPRWTRRWRSSAPSAGKRSSSPSAGCSTASTSSAAPASSPPWSLRTSGPGSAAPAPPRRTCGHCTVLKSLQRRHAGARWGDFSVDRDAYPRVFRRWWCQESPSGKTGQAHQYQGFNQGALGKVMTLLGPQGMLHRSFKSASGWRIPWCFRDAQRGEVNWAPRRGFASLTVVGGVHLVAQGETVGALELGSICRRMEQWPVEQVGKVAHQETLVCAVRVPPADLQFVEHVVEDFHGRLQHNNEAIRSQQLT